ncbi:hypothetical protein HDU76_002415 [Blyttiomyces sp. JEL0837]|nr:hypothetical protein HDU76_002415 [Blyttiomyces sp. JEL0837]
MISNSWLLSLALSTATAITSFPSSTTAQNPTDYITARGSNLRSGYFPKANLDPAVVSSNSFGRLFLTSLPIINNQIPGQAYASPLVYTPSNAGQVVVVATETNNLYTVDATNGTLIASRNLEVPFNVARDIQACGDLTPWVGITGTPVIDPDTSTLYAFTKTYSTPNGVGADSGRYKLHAVDVLTLAEKPGFPVDLQGVQAGNDETMYFEGGKVLQRPALMLMNNIVYGAFGAHCDLYNFTGWIIGVDKTTGSVVSSYSTTSGGKPNGAGLWMSGGGIASDQDGRMFVVSGNGESSPLQNPTDGKVTPSPNVLGMSVIGVSVDKTSKKLSTSDFFSPYNYQALNGGDRDFGSGGITILPPSMGTASIPNLCVAAGKTGNIYLMNCDNLGGFAMGLAKSDNVLQVIQGPGSVYSQAAAYPNEGGYIYVNFVGYPMIAYKMSLLASGIPTFTAAGKTAVNNRFGVGSPQVSSLNGIAGTGIVWFMDYSGTLFAYSAVPNADGTINKLFSDSLNGNYPYNKFTAPAIGNGKVYVASSDGRLVCYGSPTNQPLTAPDTSYGTVVITQPVSRSVTFTAAVAVQVTGYTLTNANWTVSAPIPTFPVTLAKGQNLTFVVTCNPNVPGTITGSLDLQTNAGNRALAYASLHATVQSNTPLLELTPKALSYEGLVTGSGSVTANAFLSNAGAQPLTITGVSLPGAPFAALSVPAAGTVIQPGGSLTFSVVFNPTADGSYGDYLRINSTGGNTYIIVSGTSAGPPQLVISMQQLDKTYNNATTDISFGNVVAGTSVTLNVILYNIGQTTMTVTKSKLPTTGYIMPPSVTIAEGQQIPAGQSITVPITYTAPASQYNVASYNNTAEWIVKSNDPNSGLHTLTFSGTTVSKQLTGLSNWQYVNCYYDSGNPHTLTRYAYDKGGVMTLDYCLGVCQSVGAGFGGVEYGSECYCGDGSVAMAQPVSTGCTMACQANANEVCGGPNAISLFQNLNTSVPTTTTTTSIVATSPTSTTSTSTAPTPTTTGWSSIGCYYDAVNGAARVFDGAGPNPGVQLGAGYTVEACEIGCQTKSSSYVYSGVEYGGECWCGPSIINAQKAPDSDCNMPCTANSAEICGAGSRLSLSFYNLGNTTTTSSSTSINPTSTSTTTTSTSATSPTSTTGPTQAATPTPGWNYAGCWYDAVNDSPRVFGALNPGVRVGTGSSIEAGECWCGSSLNNAMQAPESDCNMQCTANTTEICGSSFRLSIYYFLQTPSSTSSSTSATSTSTSTTLSVAATFTSSSSTLSTDVITPTQTQTSTSTSSTPLATATAIASGWKYVGCWYDAYNGAPRLFDGAGKNPGNLLGVGYSIEACQSGCLSKSSGYAYAGLEYGGECWCGPSVIDGQKAPDSDCSMPCTANSTEICGNGSRLSLYNYVA